MTAVGMSLSGPEDVAALAGVNLQDDAKKDEESEGVLWMSDAGDGGESDEKVNGAGVQVFSHPNEFANVLDMISFAEGESADERKQRKFLHEMLNGGGDGEVYYQGMGGATGLRRNFTIV